MEAVTLRGLVTCYVLFFIHLESRKVELAGVIGLLAGARQAGMVRRAARRVTGGGIARSSSVLLRCPFSRRFRLLYTWEQTFTRPLPDFCL